MRISVSASMKGREITELLEGYAENGVSFKFLGKTGLKYSFEVSGIENDEVVGLVKKLIRATSYGEALYFSVAIE